MDKTTPFPQADDFSKIESLLNLSNEMDLNDNVKLKSFLGDISDRQISYYISASIFLGLIEIKENKRFYTKKAEKIRNLNSVMQTAELIALILNNQVFSKIYSYTILLGRQEIEDVKAVLKHFYPNYSEAIYSRRSQTVISWIEWILQKTAN